MRRMAAVVLGGAAAVLLAGCRAHSDAPTANPYAGLVAFDTATIRLVGGRDTTRMTVELAETETQQTMGLMERRTLPADAGMLFVYSQTQPDTAAFWMFRTRIPLDIAFIDSTGVIRSESMMPPCPSPLAEGCPGYPARARFRAALEANAGYLAHQHIGIGDRVILADTLERRRAAKVAR